MIIGVLFLMTMQVILKHLGQQVNNQFSPMLPITFDHKPTIENVNKDIDSLGVTLLKSKLGKLILKIDYKKYNHGY